MWGWAVVLALIIGALFLILILFLSRRQSKRFHERLNAIIAEETQTPSLVRITNLK